MSGEMEINVGVVLSHSPAANMDALGAFADRVTEAAAAVLNPLPNVRWIFHREPATTLANDEPRRPSDFLDQASLHMVEGPYDLVLVVTDAPLTTRRHAVVAGLASPVTHVMVLSTRKLLITPRGQPVRQLDDPCVAANAATLVLHLIGHVLGLHHNTRRPTAMAPFRFDPELLAPRLFDERERRLLRRRSPSAEEPTYASPNPIGTLFFHLGSALRNPRDLAMPLLRNRAPLLAFSLPALATAAIAPSFILIFTAEIWDVGVNMTSTAAWIFGVGSILASTGYLAGVQNLFFPHNEKRVITEHMAVVNVTILLTIFQAVLGLFAGVVLLMLFIEFAIFPENLIREWPSLEDPQVTLGDRLRLASFIGTVGVLTGALAGGLESRTVLRHLALFLDEP